MGGRKKKKRTSRKSQDEINQIHSFIRGGGGSGLLKVCAGIIQPAFRVPKTPPCTNFKRKLNKNRGSSSAGVNVYRFLARGTIEVLLFVSEVPIL